MRWCLLVILCLTIFFCCIKLLKWRSCNSSNRSSLSHYFITLSISASFFIRSYFTLHFGFTFLFNFLIWIIRVRRRLWRTFRLRLWSFLLFLFFIFRLFFWTWIWTRTLFYFLFGCFWNILFLSWFIHFLIWWFQLPFINYMLFKFYNSIIVLFIQNVQIQNCIKNLIFLIWTVVRFVCSHFD